MDDSLEVAPGPDGRTVIDAGGALRDVPEGWDLLPPGDAAATRRVKAAGPHWVVSERRGRRRFGRGVFAPSATIRSVQRALAEERADPAHAKRLEAGRARRAREQAQYVVDFRRAVLAVLDFAPPHAALADAFADAVAAHATPVGSGTVARTRRIPIERRAEAAVLAWMRHATTEYDTMRIERVRGRRREVRRALAARSRELLSAYRSGAAIDRSSCPLVRAVEAHARPRARPGAPTDDA